jgi:hypothetical protein
VFAQSIRWRLQLWLAFLLAAILGGFGVTAYQLHRTNQLNQIDQELHRRIAALNTALHPSPPMDFPPGRPPFGDRRDRPMPEEEMKRLPPPRGFPGSLRQRGFLEKILAAREFRLSPQTMSLFDESETNGFYFLIWSRDRSLLKTSTNAPTAVPIPDSAEIGLNPDVRMRGICREAFRFTAMGDCILVGR